VAEWYVNLQEHTHAHHELRVYKKVNILF